MNAKDQEKFNAIVAMLEGSDRRLVITMMGFMSCKLAQASEHENPFKPETGEHDYWLLGWELADFETRALEMFRHMDENEDGYVH